MHVAVTFYRDVYLIALYTGLPPYLFGTVLRAFWKTVSWDIILRLAQVKFSISFLHWLLINFFINKTKDRKKPTNIQKPSLWLTLFLVPNKWKYIHMKTVIKNAEHIIVCTDDKLLYKIYMRIDWCDLKAIVLNIHLIIFIK